MTEPNSNWDDEEELKALGRVVHAFRNYGVEGELEVGRWLRQFESLSDAHKDALSHIPAKCRRAKTALETNQFFLNTMLTALKTTMQGDYLRQATNAGDRFGETTSTPSPSDMEKVKYVLKNLVRDWSQEGAEERGATYALILTELKSLYYQWGNWEKPPRVLVPGCGLARLVVEIAALGFETEGNEFSYFMLLPSSLMLNHPVEANAWTIHPWTLSTCNQISDDDQLREVPLPDIDARSLMGDTQGSMSMVAGDFVEVYSRQENHEAFECVVTSFFIDTAHNVLEYMDVIFAALKPGGFWINLGPLLYHWVDSTDESDLSIEISLLDIERIAEKMGFMTISKKFIPAPYLANTRAMFQTVYRAAFWTMQKRFNS